jgi:hypothetical protein
MAQSLVHLSHRPPRRWIRAAAARAVHLYRRQELCEPQRAKLHLMCQRWLPAQQHLLEPAGAAKP